MKTNKTPKSKAIVFRYRPISFWPEAEHVFVGDERVGIVKTNSYRSEGRERQFFQAFNRHMLPVEGTFKSRVEAARAIPDVKAIRKSKSIARGVC